MDAQKIQEFEAQIAALKGEKTALETKVSEFTEKEKTAAAEKAKADALAADEALKTEIKTFCDTMVEKGKMTPAIREKDEPIMFTLGKTSPEALKAFQEKYTIQAVTLGEHPGVSSTTDGDTRSQVLKDAEKYVTGHQKEFSGMAKDRAIAHAVYLHAVGQIKFESTN